jgi:DSF synthase
MQNISRFKYQLDESFTQLTTRFDPEFGMLWTYSDPEGVPCFNMTFLDELIRHHDQIKNSEGLLTMNGEEHKIRYSIGASLVPGVFNLGGEISLFRQLIRARDRAGLLNYATKCVDGLIRRIHHFDLPITTISLVQGDALGGGFEAVLTSDIIIAEKSSTLGFPEILFNLFPGMGAYSLLGRKVGSAKAEKIILSGKMYKAEELLEMGVVDVLAEDGDGENALYDYVRKQERRANGYQAVQRARHRFNPVTYAELLDITTIWVDAAMNLTEKDLKVMDRLVRSQEKQFIRQAEPGLQINAA